MHVTSHRARITSPLAYLAGSGQPAHIPVGPCLVEQADGRRVDIVWGDLGQSCAALQIEEMQAARDDGHLVLLD